MELPRLDLDAVRREGIARRVLQRWRDLTGGPAVCDEDRRTLVACSGGADSVSLLLMLAAGLGRTNNAVLVGHVVHDIRAAEVRESERDGVAALARRLGVRCVEAEVAVRDLPGNLEANAREARYRELERLAWEEGCPFVATAHHANDQVETMLMAMLRGAGIGGMAGMEPCRDLGERGVALVRPMLEVGRATTERVCVCAGVSWATDETNADTERLRSGLRHGAVAAMEGLRPGGIERAAETAGRLREVAGLVEDLAGVLVDKAVRAGGGEDSSARDDRNQRPVVSFSWKRSELVGEHPVVVSRALRRAYGELHGRQHADDLRARTVQRVVAAISEEKRHERCFEWKGVEVVVGSREVKLRRISQ